MLIHNNKIINNYLLRIIDENFELFFQNKIYYVFVSKLNKIIAQ